MANIKPDYFVVQYNLIHIFDVIYDDRKTWKNLFWRKLFKWTGQLVERTYGNVTFDEFNRYKTLYDDIMLRNPNFMNKPHNTLFWSTAAPRTKIIEDSNSILINAFSTKDQYHSPYFALYKDHHNDKVIIEEHYPLNKMTESQMLSILYKQLNYIYTLNYLITTQSAIDSARYNRWMDKLPSENKEIFVEHRLLRVNIRIHLPSRPKSNPVLKGFCNYTNNKLYTLVKFEAAWDTFKNTEKLNAFLVEYYFKRRYFLYWRNTNAINQDIEAQKITKGTHSFMLYHLEKLKEHLKDKFKLTSGLFIEHSPLIDFKFVLTNPRIKQKYYFFLNKYSEFASFQYTFFVSIRQKDEVSNKIMNDILKPLLEEDMDKVVIEKIPISDVIGIMSPESENKARLSISPRFRFSDLQSPSPNNWKSIQYRPISQSFKSPQIIHRKAKSAHSRKKSKVAKSKHH